MATEQATDFTLDTAAELAAEEHGAIEGRSPWYLAWRRLRRNYVALAFFVLFVLIVVACSLAPLYAHYVAHTGPNTTHIADTVVVSGKRQQVIRGGGFTVSPSGELRPAGGVKILGPTWWHAG